MQVKDIRVGVLYGHLPPESTDPPEPVAVLTTINAYYTRGDAVFPDRATKENKREWDRPKWAALRFSGDYRRLSTARVAELCEEGSQLLAEGEHAGTWPGETLTSDGLSANIMFVHAGNLRGDYSDAVRTWQRLRYEDKRRFEKQQEAKQRQKIADTAEAAWERFRPIIDRYNLTIQASGGEDSAWCTVWLPDLVKVIEHLEESRDQ